jgi:hypothetical protein
MSLFRRKRGATPTIAVADSGPRPTPIGAITAREQVTIVGQVLGIRIRPSDELPTLVVRLGDESGSVTLVWTGRGAVGGVSLGRRMRVDGTPVHTNEGVCIYNPTYTLLA